MLLSDKYRDKRGIRDMPGTVTASMLYNFVQCPHRVSLDLYGNPADRDPVSVFVQLLWEKGNAFEQEVIRDLKIPFTDLSSFRGEKKEAATSEAMRRRDALIYSGRIRAGELVGEPDLLRRQNNGYVAGDIKSGAGEEGASDLEEGKPKKHYAVQLALYTDILEKIGMSGGRCPFVWDVHGKEITYDLEALQGNRKAATLWSIYQEVLSQVISINSGIEQTLPAYAGVCKLCHWRTVCMNAILRANDLTLVPELGRSKRDAMLAYVRTVSELAHIDINSLLRGNKSVIPNIGPETLLKFQTRARLQVKPDAEPFLTEPAALPGSALEIFFDIETDPMRDVCYLHGFTERRNQDNCTETYYPFFAEEPTPEEEERAFAGSWQYIRSSRPCVIYYYSKYERTIWRKLQKKYPHVATEQEIEDLFSPEQSVDLYFDVVQRKTVWPTRDHSIKTLAIYLGFAWRDTDPSGASSIEWYHRWVETKDGSIRKRILEYNEDDCIATRILLDGIRKLKVQG
ncbi:MAG: TM0106 family RecB-like putative nuclease [Nitrospirota bacterium]|nr:TM0106 family RecB-like putative nuclease [Nitrospirota bacterium]